MVKLIQQGRREEITPLICSPSSIERSERIPAQDIVGQEALIISDAFESATNGMYNPEAIEALKKIDETSPFFGWKQATLAILAFYSNNKEEMELLLDTIPGESPAAAFIPVLKKVKGDVIQLNKAEQALYNGISEDRSFISSAQSQLKDSLEEEMEEPFLETAILLIREIKNDYPEACRKLSIWLMKTASQYGFSPDLLLSQLKQIYGSAESFRLCALALAKEETEISLLFWIRSLSSRLRGDKIDDNEIGAYLDIIATTAGELSQIGGDDSLSSSLGYEAEEWNTYLSSLSSLVRHLTDNLTLRGDYSRLSRAAQMGGEAILGEIATLGNIPPLGNLSTPESLDVSGDGEEGGKMAMVKPERAERLERTERSEKKRPEKKRLEKPVQLELFA